MPSEGLRPLTVIILNFLAGYAVVAFVSRWLRRKPPAAKRDLTRKKTRLGTGRMDDPPRDGTPPPGS